MLDGFMHRYGIHPPPLTWFQDQLHILQASKQQCEVVETQLSRQKVNLGQKQLGCAQQQQGYKSR